MGVCCRERDCVCLRRDHLDQSALGRRAAVQCGNDRRQSYPSVRANSWRPISARRGAVGRIGRSPRHRAAVFFRAAVHRGADWYHGRVPRDAGPGVVHGFLITGYEYQHHGGAGVRIRGADTASNRRWRAPDAVPRILRRRSRGDVGAGQSRRSPSSLPAPTADRSARPVYGSSRLVLAHFWAAFAAFAVAIPLGAWQMLVRSPLHQWVDPEQYYRAVTAHGTVLAYVFPTLFAMGFGYAVCAVSLGRPMHGMRLAWASLWLVIVGALVAIATVAAGDATVLYTFYPPLLGSAFYYIGLLIAVFGSWLWVGPGGLPLRALEARQSRPAGAACDVLRPPRARCFGRGRRSAWDRRSSS